MSLDQMMADNMAPVCVSSSWSAIRLRGPQSFHRNLECSDMQTGMSSLARNLQCGEQRGLTAHSSRLPTSRVNHCLFHPTEDEQPNLKAPPGPL